MSILAMNERIIQGCLGSYDGIRLDRLLVLNILFDK